MGHTIGFILKNLIFPEKKAIRFGTLYHIISPAAKAYFPYAV
jgi:hypothetical protein